MLTLQEIENVSFRKSGLGGYRTDDVDNFVDAVIEKVRDLELQNKELTDRIDVLNHDIQKHKEKEESVQDAIITAEMTSKQIRRDAETYAAETEKQAVDKADNILKEAREEAEKLVSEAQEKADGINAETNKKAESIISDALSESAKNIDENNIILERQKENIVLLQNEASKFRDMLIDQYKEHISVIKKLSRSDEYKQYQKKLNENYPVEVPNRPKSDTDEEFVKEEKDDIETNIEYSDINTAVSEVLSEKSEDFEAIDFKEEKNENIEVIDKKEDDFSISGYEEIKNLRTAIKGEISEDKDVNGLTFENVNSENFNFDSDETNKK